MRFREYRQYVFCWMWDVCFTECYLMLMGTFRVTFAFLMSSVVELTFKIDSHSAALPTFPLCVAEICTTRVAVWRRPVQFSIFRGNTGRRTGNVIVQFRCPFQSQPRQIEWELIRLSLTVTRVLFLSLVCPSRSIISVIVLRTAASVGCRF